MRNTASSTTPVLDDAKRTLVEEHLALVEHIVLKASANFPRFVDRQDLVAAGTVGLIEAATRFEAGREVPFASFASRRIKGAVLDAVRSADWAPRSVRQQVREAEDASQSLANRLGRRPTDAEVEGQLGLGSGDLAQLRGQVDRGVVQALDSRHGGDGYDAADRLTDRTQSGPDEVVEDEETRGYLRAALRHLPERHRLVIVGYYLEGRSFEQLAGLLGVTTSRVSQLRSDALDMMRDGIDAQYEPPETSRPKGRVAIRQARFAGAIAQDTTPRRTLSYT